MTTNAEPPGPDRDAHGGRTPNRLADQTSPYLLQHQYNPVDWRPWGDAAFEEARRRGAPIFLSVGYSTCYWCHVMERQCFEDAAIAGVLNEHFVCVKVDREERPDVDDIYMAAVQLFNDGQGGWPMSVWLTPPGASGPEDMGLAPIYAGTYFPPTPDPRYGRPSLTMISERIAEAWRDDRAGALRQAEAAAAAVRERLAEREAPVRIDEGEIALAVDQLLRIHDEQHGGFGDAPKFPQPAFAEFLFEVMDSIESPAVRARVEAALRKTLDEMALGGMYDQVGGGFHRYSTDAAWRVPHFEKMLYDNAQLASLYTRAFERFGDEFYARVVRETLAYVEREMTGPDGMFYSAQDAEVEAKEGLNYLWRPEEFDAVLGEDAAFAKRLYNLDAGPNFRDPHHADEPGRNVLHLSARPAALAASFELAPAALLARIESVDARLYAARSGRLQPGLDDKVILAWNGLMLAGLADAAAGLREPAYLDAAERAADALWRRLRDADGLRRTHRAGAAGSAAFLEDYAMFAHGLLAMHRAAARLGRANAGEHLARAVEVVEQAEQLFRGAHGGFYDTREAQPDLLVRTTALHDGALPAGSSVMLHNYIVLYEAAGRAEDLANAEALLASMSAGVARAPLGAVNTTRALHRLMSIAEGVPDRLGPAASDPATAGSGVQILAPVNRLTIPSAGAATLSLRLLIEPGRHVNAHDPGVEGMTGLTVRVEGGAGVELSAAYPAGAPYRGGGLPEGDGPLLVHEGEAVIELTLRRGEGPWRGRPMLTVEYQVCTDAACLAPARVELDVALDPGG